MDYNKHGYNNRNRCDDDDDDDRRRSNHTTHHGSGRPRYDQPPPSFQHGNSGYGSGNPPSHQHGAGYGGNLPSQPGGYGGNPASQHGAGCGGSPPSQHGGYGVHHASQFGGYGGQYEGSGGTGHGGQTAHQSRVHDGHNSGGGSRPSSHGVSYGDDGCDNRRNNKPTFKVYCKKDPRFSLTVKHNTVVLAPTDASDPHQHWYKDEKYTSQLQDEEGYPCFSLVNKATNLAMKHSKGAEPVQLELYDPSVMDGSLLWTMSQDFGEGYRTIRRVNNIRLNVDALHGDQRIENGTKIVLWEWNQGANQLWKIERHHC